jgi:uncharacterized protein (TIRG00374 family)
VSVGKKAWNIAWRIGVCVLLLGWIFHAIFLNEAKVAAERNHLPWKELTRSQQWQQAWQNGPPELWQSVSHIEPSALIMSVLAVGLVLFVGVIRWRIVLEVQGLHLSWGRATEICAVAHFFNSFLLGSTGGDLMRAYYAARETHHKKTEAVVTVFVDRLVGLWAMLLFASIMMIPNVALISSHNSLRAVAAFVLAMTIACTVIVGLAFWGGVSKRWPGARARLRQLPKGAYLEKSLDSCREFGQHPAFVPKSLAISMLLNTLTVIQVWFLAKGMHLNISPVALMMIVPTVVLIAAMPITPSGLGVRENLFVLMLSAPSIAVPATSALSLSLLAFAGSLFWSLVGGIVYATLRERHHLKESELNEGENATMRA